MAINKDKTKRKNKLVSNKKRISTKEKRSKVTGTVIDLQKQAEEAQRLQSEITKNMAEGVILTRAKDAVIIYTNPRFEEMFGYGSGELIGKNIAIVNAPTDKSPEEIAGEILKSLKETGMWQGEVKNIKKDGTPFWCQANVSTYKHSEHGDVWIATHIDITKRKQAEEALKLSEQNFRNSMENSPLGIRIVKEDGETLYTNRAFLDIYGYNSLKEFTATSVKDRYTPDSYVEFHDRREKRRHREPLPDNYEVSIVRKDGEIRRLHVIRKGILWGGKQQYQTIYNDITERKEAEEALKVSETRYRRLFETACDGILIQDVATGVVIDVNPFLIEILGFPQR